MGKKGEIKLKMKRLKCHCYDMCLVNWKNSEP